MMARFEAALVDRTLFRLVREMEAEGQRQVEIFDCFDQFRALLREIERDADEDHVMDTMDLHRRMVESRLNVVRALSDQCGDRGISAETQHCARRVRTESYHVCTDLRYYGWFCSLSEACAP